MGLSPGFGCDTLYFKGAWGEGEGGDCALGGGSGLSSSYVSGPGPYTSESITPFTFTKEQTRLLTAILKKEN